MVELLAVIVIIGILAALLLPAILSVRDAAYGMQCKNNLRQIALALSAYHESRGHLPSGWIGDADTDEPGWGWASDLLFYLEQDDLATQIARRDSIADQRHADVRKAIVPVFMCPLDSTPETFTIHSNNGSGDDASSKTPSMTMARANYAGVFGSGGIDDDPDQGNGLFYRNSKISLRSVRDGLNNTLMVGERSSRLGATTWVGVVPGVSSARARVVGTAETVPNDVLSHFAGFSSYHPGLANFLSAGGTVTSINDDIDQNVFNAKTTRAAGDDIDEPDDGGTDDGGTDDGGAGDDGGTDDGHSDGHTDGHSDGHSDGHH